jgi:hypothetical protein
VAVNQQQSSEGAEPTGSSESALPTFPEQIATQLGGWRGMIEAAVPIASFIVVNVVWALEPALLVSIGVALAIAATRLAQRRPVRYAINGLFGIGIGAFLAWRSGDARDFYLPGILISYLYVVLFIGSVLIRHPLVGWLWSIMFDGGRSTWRQDPVLMRTLTWLTLVWAVVWVVKVSIQFGFYLADMEHALGAARIVLGTPVFALMLAITIWTVGRVQQRQPVQA